MAPALLACGRSLAVAPDFADAHMNLGIVLCDVGEWSRAVAVLAVAAAQRPHSTLTLANLGSALFRADRLEEASGVLRRALALEPGHVAALSNLALLEQAEFAHERAQRRLRRALASRWSIPVHSNLVMQLCYDPATTNDALFAEASRRWLSWHVGVYDPAYRGSADHRPLRIGWLSGDLHEHPVARNIVGLLEHRDRARFQAFVYSTGRRADAMTRRLRSLADGWRDVAGLDDNDVAKSIHDDRIDILVVLAGHTGGSRREIAFARPAALQVSFHDLTTSGLEQMDAWITDPILHPPDTMERFSERLLRLPCFYLYEPPVDAPPPSSRRGDVPPTFGSFNNTSKLSPALLRLWARILRAVPDARLLLKYQGRFADRGLREKVIRLFAECGVGAERLLFHSERSSRGDYLAMLSATDVALDTFPFNGSTTTFETLWMGVPVITLAGERFAGRVGASVLSQIGLQDLIADSPDAYVDMAVRLANNREYRQKLRASLRDRLRASPLCQPESHARDFEAALRGLWRGA
jgi:predicted O-linked N-acetylglucosamine transferase (SPINDLY family)